MDPQALKDATDRARFEGEVTEQLRTLFGAVKEVKDLLSEDRSRTEARIAALESRVKPLELWRSYTAGYIAASGAIAALLTAFVMKLIS